MSYNFSTDYLGTIRVPATSLERYSCTIDFFQTALYIRHRSTAVPLGTRVYTAIPRYYSCTKFRSARLLVWVLILLDSPSILYWYSISSCAAVLHSSELSKLLLSLVCLTYILDTPSVEKCACTGWIRLFLKQKHRNFCRCAHGEEEKKSRNSLPF